jgi:hypothetical protein
VSSDEELERRLRAARELNERLKRLEPVLSRLSDEEIVRVIREDRDTDHGRDPGLPRLLRELERRASRRGQRSG